MSEIDPEILERGRAAREQLSPDLRDRLTADNGGPPGEEAFSIVQADPTTIRNARWAWDLRVKISALNAIIGVGGAGKSTLVAMLLAKWTRGELPGHFHGTPVNVLVIGDEDTPEESWTPKVMAMEGDTSHLYYLRYDAGRPLDLVRDVRVLEQHVRDYEIQVVYLDQVLDHLPPGANANQAQDVRSALGPLRGLATGLEIATLYIQHPNKMGGHPSLRDRAGQSGQFTDLTRSSLFLGYHPELGGREQGSYRALVRGKGNVGAIPPALVFRVEPTLAINPATKDAVDVAVISDMDEDEDVGIEDVLSHQPGKQESPKSEELQRFLMGLGADGEWRRRKDTERMCVEEGYGLRMFREVFRYLPKETKPDEDDKRETWWRLKDVD